MKITFFTKSKSNLLPGGVYDCTKHSMVGCVVGPKLVFAPTGNFMKKRGPLSFGK